MTTDYKRRIHIIGKPDNIIGHMLKVYDADTSEPITNIARIVITLDASEMNKAEVTYYEMDEHGHIVANEDREPVQHTVTLDNPSFNLTVQEVNTEMDGKKDEEIYARHHRSTTTTTDIPTDQLEHSTGKDTDTGFACPWPIP